MEPRGGTYWRQRGAATRTSRTPRLFPAGASSSCSSSSTRNIAVSINGGRSSNSAAVAAVAAPRLEPGRGRRAGLDVSGLTRGAAAGWRLRRRAAPPRTSSVCGARCMFPGPSYRSRGGLGALEGRLQQLRALQQARGRKGWRRLRRPRRSPRCWYQWRAPLRPRCTGSISVGVTS